MTNMRVFGLPVERALIQDTHLGIYHLLGTPASLGQTDSETFST